MRVRINKLLADQHSAGNGAVDLVNPYYHGTTMDHLTGYQSDSRTYSGYGLYQAFWSRSDFCFVSDAARDIRLDLTARLPAAANEKRDRADVHVALNGHEVGTVQVRKSWSCKTLNVRREKLKIGVNRLTIGWPDLSLEGDTATSHIHHRLERAVPTNLEPVFGELQSLLARS